MNLDDLTVVVPRKEGVATHEEPVAVWPLVEAALQKIEADDVTCEAARIALSSSDGCVVLANYLNSEAKRIHRMDYQFKIPLIVLAAERARDDDGADSIYDKEEGAIYFETDEGQYSFHVFKDWTVDWEAVADEVINGYEWTGVENQTWALDQLLTYLDFGERLSFGGDT
ncbi:MAG: hypothetical protein ACE5G0_02450 [Rhodothermales bacterium]